MTTNKRARRGIEAARLAVALCTLTLGGLLVLGSKEAPQVRVGPCPAVDFFLNSGWTIPIEPGRKSPWYLLWLRMRRNHFEGWQIFAGA